MNDIKQVILVRNDLQMSPGKACAQVGHASMLFFASAIKNAMEYQKAPYFSLEEIRWMFDNGPLKGAPATYGGMKKIVLGVDNLTDLNFLDLNAKVLGFKSFRVFDEGLNAITACSIGPDYSDDIDKLTGHLELYGPFEVDHPQIKTVEDWWKEVDRYREKNSH